MHHVSQWTEQEDPCEMCLEEDESTSHIYFECPALWQLRREIKSLNLGVEKSVLRFFSEERNTDPFNMRSRSCTSSVLFN